MSETPAAANTLDTSIGIVISMAFSVFLPPITTPLRPTAILFKPSTENNKDNINNKQLKVKNQENSYTNYIHIFKEGSSTTIKDCDDNYYWYFELVA